MLFRSIFGHQIIDVRFKQLGQLCIHIASAGIGRSRRQLVYYILSSLFCQELFSFFESFSLNRFCPICYLKRDNSDILSCVVLFVNNFFYFPKDKQSSIFFPPQQKCLSFAVDFYTTIIVRICQHFFVYKKFIMSVRITLFSYRYFNNLL